MSAKFRAWDLYKKEFICVGYYVIGETTLFNLIEQHLDEDVDGRRVFHGCDKDGYYTSTSKSGYEEKRYYGSLEALDDVIEQQYIGLQDINNIDVYAGDILCFHHSDFDWYGIVHIDLPVISCYGLSEGYDILMGGGAEDPFEIVGHIYSIPDYIKEKYNIDSV